MVRNYAGYCGGGYANGHDGPNTAAACSVHGRLVISVSLTREKAGGMRCDRLAAQWQEGADTTVDGLCD